MKIYFSTSVTGGRGDAQIYFEIVKLLKEYGDVLSEKNGDLALTSMGDTDITNEQIYDRDMKWVNDSDVLVAEVTTPSLGVGYEIASASHSGKPILCLYRETPGRRLSSMIQGDRKIIVKTYVTVSDIPAILKEFFK